MCFQIQAATFFFFLRKAICFKDRALPQSRLEFLSGHLNW
jgi:hypothetical protein